ncbi:hypothetical protein FIBSPDRAFT_926890 [Athelia psychrophila]|uniref:Arrestin-like N-terminal domain-containing protein n=1 Tax=Athelia psychrophila TaxID=1759441 RepID=A0A166SRM4_9AGAM|nr:hypothetical protein FIBSPDRAFT_926890 [Fibularhizoctonia sp. CBS 109695]
MSTPTINADAALPGYQATESHSPPSYRRPDSVHHTRHVFSLKKPHTKRVWGTLEMGSCAKSSSAIPILKEGESITGVLELDLESDGIHQIDIKLIGQFVGPISGPRSREPFVAGPDTFLEASQPLWSRKTSMTSVSKPNGKHSWEFSFALPTKATTAPKTLPPSLSESNISFGVRYEFFAHIRRGKLRSNDRIGTLITYMPRLKPETPSPLRSLAYRDGTAIPGPDQDPEGWITLPSVLVKGSIFSTRDIQIKATLSLAAPLSYTQGTAIPTVMVLESADEEALDLLSATEAIVVSLQRHVIWGTPTKTDKQALHRGSALDYPSLATWDHPIKGDQRRTFEGEIQLLKNIPASFALGKFAIEYQVLMFPFKMTAFKPHDDGPVARQRVDIANFFADGPHAKQLRPPTSGVKSVQMGSTLGNLVDTPMTMFP